MARGVIEILLAVLAAWALLAHVGTLINSRDDDDNMVMRATAKLIACVIALGFLGLMVR